MHDSVYGNVFRCMFGISYEAICSNKFIVCVDEYCVMAMFIAIWICLDWVCLDYWNWFRLYMCYIFYVWMLNTCTESMVCVCITCLNVLYVCIAWLELWSLCYALVCVVLVFILNSMSMAICMLYWDHGWDDLGILGCILHLS